MDKYLKLLSPVRAGRHILKNRLLSTDSLPNKIQGPETFPAEGFRALMSQIAKSAAVVTLAEWNNKDARELPIAMAHQPVYRSSQQFVHDDLVKTGSHDSHLHSFGSNYFSF